MPLYQSPGVYVQEVPSGARPIQAVGTSTAGFIGVTPDATARVGDVVAVEGWLRFCDIFAATADDQRPVSTDLSQAVRGFFDNGGRRLHVLNLGSEDAPLTGTRSGLALFESVEEIAIVAAPGRTDPTDHEALTAHCEKMEDRVAILDGPARVEDLAALTRTGTAAVPTTSAASGEDHTGDGEEADEEGGASPPPSPPAGEESGLRPRASSYTAFYYPRLVVTDPFTGRPAEAPPSGHLAGIYARVDGTRGVHKAPANEPIRGAVNLTDRVTREGQGVLNPKGVNCLRYFPAEGIKVWGARTLEPDSEYRYVPVRRLVNMLKESIAGSTRWVVFEPNDHGLWKAITRDVRAFLMRVWRDGALMGRTPEEAFFVKCDEETNPPEAIDAGEVRCVIGISPVKPAEFVIFEISHTERGAESTESSE